MVVFFVLAHRDLAQVERLLRTLGCVSCGRLLHVDSATDLSADAHVMEALRADGVRIVPRHRCPWGGFGLVEATLAGMRVAVGEFPAMTHLVVLSGQDYPIRPPAKIVAFYEARPGASFMEHHRLPRADWADGGIRRLTDLHVPVGGRRLGIPLSRIGLARRVPGDRIPYQGGQAWTLAADAVRLVIDVADHEPGYLRFFRRTAHADESFFQTIVMNSPLAARVVNDDKRYEDWTAAGPHPAVLTVGALPALAASTAHFAKKFDAGVDAGILDLIDERLLTPHPADGRRR